MMFGLFFIFIFIVCIYTFKNIEEIFKDYVPNIELRNFLNIMVFISIMSIFLQIFLLYK